MSARDVFIMVMSIVISTTIMLTSLAVFGELEQRDQRKAVTSLKDDIQELRSQLTTSMATEAKLQLRIN